MLRARIAATAPVQAPHGVAESSRASEGSSVPTSPAPASPLTVIAWRLGTLTLTDLWWCYTALGGNRPRAELSEYLTGTAAWPAAEHNTLAQALNENLWDLGHPSVAPYRELQEERHWVAARGPGSGERS